jgi:16S rRNA (cytosine1402-N4)-methyltransferase
LLHHVSPGGRLIAVDFDPKNIDLATTVLQAVGGEFSLFHNNFAALPTILTTAGVEHVDGILADLGVASPQIDDPARGFSYKHDGPLDMRMDPTRGQPASVLINRIKQDELERTLIELGDEEDAAAIAELVVQRRKIEPITTCAQLTQIVCDARDFTLQRALGAKLHPAARTFQALRILVNRELANLQRLLAIAPACLKPGGTIAIISFHSGEDRIVKDAFKAGLHGGQFEETSREPIVATELEREDNPRSRSAKLRWARTPQ